MSQVPKPTVANYREFKAYPKIVAAVARILARQRFVAPVDVFLEMNLLPAGDLDRWKRGQIPVLERVIRCNLTKDGCILRLLRFHAHDLKLKPSLTVYQHRGHRLRFSRSGEPKIEKRTPPTSWWSANAIRSPPGPPPRPPPLPPTHPLPYPAPPSCYAPSGNAARVRRPTHWWNPPGPTTLSSTTHAPAPPVPLIRHQPTLRIQ
jgi:hypothetical protein